VLRLELEARDLPEPRRSAANDALLHLERWDRVSRVDSTPMTLYFYWRHAMRSLNKTDPVEAFEYAIDYMQDTYGTWRVAWGEVNRLQRAHTSGTAGFDDDARSLPVAGGPGNPFGMIFNVYARPEPGRRKMYGIAGHSYVSVVEFGKTPRARSIMTFGSSADPQSPHYFDQAALFATQRFKSAWFNLEDVRADAQSAVKLQYP
jgi:penicillin amidase